MENITNEKIEISKNLINEQTNLLVNINDNMKEIIQLLIDLKNDKINKKENISFEVSENIPKKREKVIKKPSSKKTLNIVKNFNKKIYLSEFKNALLLHGNTYDIKDFIKSLGGFWNSNLKGWLLHNDNKSKLIETIKHINISDKMEKELNDEFGVPFNLKMPKKKIKNCFLNSDSE